MSSFLAELKRRRVFRVAIVYAVAAWAIIQVSDTVLPRLALPDWSVTLVIALVILGAPIALILAWAFDVGPDGIQRAEPVAAQTYSRGSVASRLALVGAVAVLATAGLAFFTRGRASNLDENRVAVAVFENRTQDENLTQLGRMTSDLIIRGLTESGLVDVAGAPVELDKNDKVNSLEDQIRILAHTSGAGVVVTGSFYNESGNTLIVAQISDAKKGKVLRTIGPVKFDAGSATRGVEEMQQFATGGVLALMSPAGQGFVSMADGAHLPSYQAYRLYLQGVKEFQDRNYEKSAEHFERAFQVDTLFLLSRIRAGYAYGNDPSLYDQVDSLAVWFESRRERLSAFEAAYLDRAIARPNGDMATVYRASREMARLRPESHAVRYIAARDAIPVNRPRETIEMLKTIDFEGPGLPDGPDAYRDMSIAYHMLGEYQKELKISRRATARFAGSLEALSGEIFAVAALGRMEDLSALADELELQRTRSSGVGPGELLLGAAAELLVHGYEEESREMAGRAAAYSSTQKQNFRVALALTLAGDLSEASAILDTMATPTQQARGLQGLIAALQGDREKAEAITAELPEVAGSWRVDSSHLIRARIAAVLGENERAVRLIRQAIAQGTPFGLTLHQDPWLARLKGFKSYDTLMKPRD